MREGTRTALLVEGHLDEEFVKRAAAAVAEAPPEERISTGLEAAIEVAETDPAAASAALIELRGDHEALARLEQWLGGEPRRATFGLGAALQVAAGELASAAPDLRGRLPELLRWMEGDW
jgi:hypothetical protein